MATTDSVGECPYVILIEEIAVSTLSIPASIAFNAVAVDRPVVA
jgi:hypothetical protein